MKDIKPDDAQIVTGGGAKLLPPMDTSYLRETVIPGPRAPGDVPDYTPPDDQAK